MKNGPYRWLTVQYPGQPHSQLGLFHPGPPTHDAATAAELLALAAKGAMPPLVLVVKDCHATSARLVRHGVETIQSRTRT